MLWCKFGNNFKNNLNTPTDKMKLLDSLIKENKVEGFIWFIYRRKTNKMCQVDSSLTPTLYCNDKSPRLKDPVRQATK